MNELLALLIAFAVGAAAYSVCAFAKHGTCNIGDLFTLLVLIFGLVIGIVLFVRVWVIARTHPLQLTSIEESAWTAVAAIVLCISSTQEIIVKFRQLFAKPVTPIKPEQDK